MRPELSQKMRHRFAQGAKLAFNVELQSSPGNRAIQSALRHRRKAENRSNVVIRGVCSAHNRSFSQSPGRTCCSVVRLLEPVFRRQICIHRGPTTTGSSRQAASHHLVNQARLRIGDHRSCLRSRNNSRQWAGASFQIGPKQRPNDVLRLGERLGSGCGCLKPLSLDGPVENETTACGALASVLVRKTGLS